MSSTMKHRSSSATNDSDADPASSTNLWQSILRQTAARTADGLETKYALVLGDRQSGKSSLIARLQGLNLAECPPKGIALDYTFLDVEATDDAAELLTRIGVWSLEGDDDLSYLLRFSLTKETFRKMMVIITLDFSQPWNLSSSLESWLSRLASHIEQVVATNDDSVVSESAAHGGGDGSEDLLSACKSRLVRRWRSFKEPSSLVTTKDKGTRSSSSNAAAGGGPEDVGDDRPLGEGVLSDNLGIPVVVVCCKTDCIAELEKKYNYHGDYFDYIQQHLRRICLRYGASLLYSSAKQDVNTEALFDVMKNTLYSFELSHTPELVEREATFIPSGWDSLDKIDLDFANQSFCDDPTEAYEEVVKIPGILKEKAAAARHKAVGSPTSLLSTTSSEDSFSISLSRMEVAAEDDQEFLMRHVDYKEKDRAAIKVSTTPRTPEEAMAQKSSATPDDFVLGGQGESPVALGSAKGKSPYSTPNAKPSRLSALAKEPKTPAQVAASPRPAATPSDHKVLADFFNSLLSGTPQSTPLKDEKKE